MPALEKLTKYIIQIGPERFRAPEILFDPEIIGLEYSGVHQMVVDAINRTDMDLRTNLFANIVLSGGSTLCKGFPDRLLHEMQRLAVKEMRIRISAPPERKYSTWIGGSILAGLSTFRKVCIDRLIDRSPRRSRFLRCVCALTGWLSLCRCGSASMTGMRIQI
jgi:actin-related protein